MYIFKILTVTVFIKHNIDVKNNNTRSIFCLHIRSGVTTEFFLKRTHDYWEFLNYCVNYYCKRVIMYIFFFLNMCLMTTRCNTWIWNPCNWINSYKPCCIPVVIFFKTLFYIKILTEGICKLWFYCLLVSAMFLVNG